MRRLVLARAATAAGGGWGAAGTAHGGGARTLASLSGGLASLAGGLARPVEVAGGAGDAAAARPITSAPCLPIIDVRPLLDEAASPASVAAVASKLHVASRDVGFFYASGLEGVIDGVPGLLSAAAEWFARPEEEKARAALSPSTNYRGWQPLGANVTRYGGADGDGGGGGGGFVRDAHEGLDLYYEPRPGSSLRPSPLHGTNPWPDGAPAFVGGLKAHIASCLHLGQAITRGMAAGLGLPPTFFEGPGGGFTDASSSAWVTRVISYPPLPPAAAAAIENAKRSRGDLPRHVGLSCGEHCDYGLLTFVSADEPGLEVRNADGDWIAAEPVDGAVVCNTGDMWRLWSAGAYTPTLHRVVYTGAGRPRTSVAFFYEPAFGARVRAPPQLPGAAAMAGEEVEYGAHLESKVLSNFEL